MANAKVKPFTSNLEYISASLDYLLALARKRALGPLIEARKDSRRVTPEKQAELEALTGSDDSSLPSLERAFRRLAREVKRRHRQLAMRTQRTLTADQVELPLESLASEHGLGEFEKLVLLLILGPDLDNHFKQVIEAASNCHGIEIRLVLDILCDNLEEKIKARRYFINSGKLLGRGLLNLAYSRRVDSESDFMSMDLELPRQVSSLMLGEFDIDDQIISFSSVTDPKVELDQVVLPAGKREEVLQLLLNREDYLACRQEWGFDRILAYGKGTVILFSGPSGTGKTMLAHALAKATGHRLMLVDFRKIENHSPRHTFEDNLGRIFHEARLQNAIILFDEADEMFADRSANGAMPTLLREFEKLDGIVILATNRRHLLDEALERRIMYKLDFELPTPELREEIWRCHLPADAPLATDIDLHALAEEFEFSGGYIKNAVLVAVHRTMQRHGKERRITQADLRAGAGVQRRNRLAMHTDKVIPKVSLNDVVLPDMVKQQVRAITAAARKRSTVFSTWGFGRKLSLGKAITVLFAGESGVGKTMTAEAIAFELGQNLYPVSLPATVSMWVGQTEKNLAAVFAAAREAQAILFFDEADALFSARLEEGNHHAHYINQQVNVLLTEIEKFDGMVILATNRAEAIDQAFERRIRYRISFPKPDAVAREAIWRGLIPPEAPLAAEVDFAILAKDYDFTGGTIKNVVLRAAFAAATNGQVINMADLRQAAEEEEPLQKAAAIGFARPA